MKTIKIIAFIIWSIISFLFFVYGFVQKTKADRCNEALKVEIRTLYDDAIETNFEYFDAFKFLKDRKPSDSLIDSLWKSSVFLQFVKEQKRDSLIRSGQ